MDPIAVSILLLIAGLALIFVELMIPSAGLIGVISAAVLIAGIVVAFNAGFVPGLIVLILTLTSVPIVIALLLKVWPNTPIGRRLFISPPKAEDVSPEASLVTGLETLIGQHGTARSKLLPAGNITIDGKHYDAVSDGMPIEKDQPIEVIAVKAQRIIVRPTLKETQIDSPDNALSQSIESLGLEAIDDPLQN